ncbi:hypothetical protein A2U01_0065338, partial [Trifolium medium]|nr:hypothetical protein [Trifolium medium]
MLALTSGSTAPASDLEGCDKGAPAIDAHLGATSLPPPAASSTSPSFWDPLFNPVEFIERQLC